MKLPHPFSIFDFRFSICKKPATGNRPLRGEQFVANRKSAIVNRKSGVALVITLIMLSVTLVMAIAFLAISRRERNSVGTSTDTTVARLAADTAAAAAQAQIVANMLATNTAEYDFRLLVSTNYQNPAGYFTGVQNPTNVNFDYRFGGGALNSADFEQNVANLLFLPRVPVTIDGDFRYYLDLNRNGRFETNGYTFDLDENNFFLDTNSPTFKVGDPEWVGILERPDAPHGPNNHFVARYAFLAQPIGNTLDLNAIHNQADYSVGNQNAVSVFLRNQGVGTWELNLAGFLVDLNTNAWDNPLNGGVYNYRAPGGLFNTGAAFEDAFALLSYRYSYNFAHLANANFVMGGAANTILRRDNIDTYSDGPLQITTTNIDEGVLLNQDNPALSWSGANNPTNFYALPSELFDPNKVGVNFTNRLLSLGNSNASYNRYTFYRMLDQLGTDSTADDARMNLNYNNVTATNFSGSVGATNLIDWTPLAFFTNAADRLIRQQSALWLAQNFQLYTNTFGSLTTSAFSLTNIPVYVNGQFVYAPAVQRLLQLSANLYDASTNDFFPSVFRPQFREVVTNGYRNVYISGFVDVRQATGALTPGTAPLDVPLNVNDPLLVSGAGVNTARGNIYGVPWIVGAKKGLPNFNRFYSLNNVQVTRKLQVTRDRIEAYATASSHYKTNEMFVMSITNSVGWSFWNSYDTNYARQLRVVVRDEMGMELSNSAAAPLGPLVWPGSTVFFADFFTNNWPGSAWTSTSDTWDSKQPSPNSFIYGTWDYPFLPEAIYRLGARKFEALTANPAWEVGIAPVSVFPQFYLRTTNQVQAYLIDTVANRIVDYVHFDGPNSLRDINNEIKDVAYQPTTSPDRYMWSTNQPTGGNTPNWGVLNQLDVARIGPSAAPAGGAWKSSPNLPTGMTGTPGQPEAAYFDGFFKVNFRYPNAVSGTPYYNSNFVQQVPYTPARLAYEYTMWQANDPLVHYLASDLQNTAADNVFGHSDGPSAQPMPDPRTVLAALDSEESKVKSRYQPWGRNDQLAGMSDSVEKDPFNLAIRDSLVWGSDFWDFPTNKYPTVGWIGRVHRGTPWQTVYLKSTDQLLSSNNFGNTGVPTWKVWTGNQNEFDAAHSAPEQDRLLFDVFTTAPNDNATRGALSINQQNLAAWSAVFSGLVALTNITDTVVLPSATSTPILTNTIIPPASVDQGGSAVWQIVEGVGGINDTRTNRTLFPQGVFTHVGDILRVPMLTEESPFLNRPTGEYLKYDISDELYEWLPQQTLGLLRLGTPRFVMYCYGQALRPARDGQVLSGGSFGLITNYQVVAESATRVVLRVDKHVTGNSTNYSTVVESSTPLSPD